MNATMYNLIGRKKGRKKERKKERKKDRKRCYKFTSNFLYYREPWHIMNAKINLCHSVNGLNREISIARLLSVSVTICR